MTSEQEIRNKQFKQVTGSAPNFRAIDGVGPKTAEKVKDTFIEGQGRVQAPTDVQDLTDDELAKKAGISKNRARKVIKGAGGNPDRKPRSTTGSVSAAGIRVPVGEFKPEIGDNDNAKARFETSLNRGIGRSQNAAIADKSKRAPVTTDFDRWKENKGELDFPGVDTPSDDPQVLPKDLRQEQRPATTDPPDPPQTRTQPPETPSTEKGTQAPEPLTSGLFTQDVSLSPEEAFEGAGRGDPGGASGVGAGARVDEQRRLGSGRPPDIARGEDPFDMTDDGGALDSGASQQFDRTVTVGITPATSRSRDGFTIQTDDDTADRTLGSGTEVVEQAQQNLDLPSPGEADSTDVVAEAEIGLEDRDSGIGYNTQVVETRETDDTIFNFR